VARRLSVMICLCLRIGWRNAMCPRGEHCTPWGVRCMRELRGRGSQGLPYDEPYVAVFENMDTVVFFNGCGNEAHLWQQYAGGALSTRETEGAAPGSRPPSGSALVSECCARDGGAD